ncbi:hypothetical protein BD309DRAFT_985147, partial [Dichomitus squalens]
CPNWDELGKETVRKWKAGVKGKGMGGKKGQQREYIKVKVGAPLCTPIAREKMSMNARRNEGAPFLGADRQDIAGSARKTREDSGTRPVRGAVRDARGYGSLGSRLSSSQTLDDWACTPEWISGHYKHSRQRLQVGDQTESNAYLELGTTGGLAQITKFRCCIEARIYWICARAWSRTKGGERRLRHIEIGKASTVRTIRATVEQSCLEHLVRKPHALLHSTIGQHSARGLPLAESYSVFVALGREGDREAEQNKRLQPGSAQEDCPPWLRELRR